MHFASHVSIPVPPGSTPDQAVVHAISGNVNLVHLVLEAYLERFRDFGNSTPDLQMQIAAFVARYVPSGLQLTIRRNGSYDLTLASS